MSSNRQSVTADGYIQGDVFALCSCTVAEASVGLNRLPIGRHTLCKRVV